ncbi:MAG TPA: DUF4390 domain-containing protein [Dongiaceae bacterium]|nr:DUF4390 domain-containing protein [Dongiaceae bacterium]
MYAKRRLHSAGLAGFCLIVLLSSLRAEALEVRVSAPGEPFALPSGQTWMPHASGDSLVAAFGIQGIFDQNQSLGDGIAATLLIVVDLWQEKSNWWDALVRSKVLAYRLRRDVWTGETELLDQSGAIRRFTDRDALANELERLREVDLGSSRDFKPGKTYYVSVKAMVRPLSLEDLENVDAWLSGKVTGSEGNGILGIPKAVARALIGASGLGDQSAIGRSLKFKPRP